jgi:hypothetical protein
MKIRELFREEGYDTQRDKDAVSGKSRKTSIGSGGGKPKGYSKDKAEKAALDNIKKMKQFSEEELDEITRRNVLKGLGLAGAAAATGAKVDIAKAAEKAAGGTAREKILAMKPGEQFWYVKAKDPMAPWNNGEYVFSLDTFKDEDDAMNTIREIFRKAGYDTNITIEVSRSVRKKLPNEAVSEDAAVTSSGDIAALANPRAAKSKPGRDKNGVPKAPQRKNPDGTAKNALDVDDTLMGSGKAIKR